MPDRNKKAHLHAVHAFFRPSSRLMRGSSVVYKRVRARSGSAHDVFDRAAITSLLTLIAQIYGA